MGTLEPCRGRDWLLRDTQPSSCLEFQKQGSGIGGVHPTQQCPSCLPKAQGADPGMPGCLEESARKVPSPRDPGTGGYCRLRGTTSINIANAFTIFLHTRIQHLCYTTQSQQKTHSCTPLLRQFDPKISHSTS